MEQACSICSVNTPVALYLWKEGHKGWEHRSLLCESCARRVGAWKLPAKPEEVARAFKPVLDDINSHIERGR